MASRSPGRQIEDRTSLVGADHGPTLDVGGRGQGRSILVRAAAVMVVSWVAACGGGSDLSGPEAGATTAPVASATTAAETVPDGPLLEVELTDYRFVGLPEAVALGTRIHVSNTSAAEIHEFIAIRVPDDEKRSVQELMALDLDELVPILGRAIPDVVLIAPPGGDQIPGTGDDRFDEPGRHIVFCRIPIGADPEEILAGDRFDTGRSPEQYAGTPEHHTLGEVAEVVVR